MKPGHALFGAEDAPLATQAFPRLRGLRPLATQGFPEKVEGVFRVTLRTLESSAGAARTPPQAGAADPLP